MNWRDRELLRRAADADRGLGYFVLELLHHGEDGELPAEGMTALGERYSELGAQLLRRAGELRPGKIQRRWVGNRRKRRYGRPGTSASSGSLPTQPSSAMH